MTGCLNPTGGDGAGSLWAGAAESNAPGGAAGRPAGRDPAAGWAPFQNGSAPASTQCLSSTACNEQLRLHLPRPISRWRPAIIWRGNFHVKYSGRQHMCDVWLQYHLQSR